MLEVKIPRHIKAKTPEELERLMFDVCRATGFQHINFSDIQFVKGSWYAWYLAKTEDFKKKEIEELKD